MSFALLDNDIFLDNSSEYLEGQTERGNAFRVEIVDMTPERAERLLERNENNRTLKIDRERNYAGQMKAGQWFFDGNPIRVDRDGILLDGQHRLYAIVESGTTQTVILITGLESQSMKSIDTGASRTLGDLLKLTVKEMKHESKIGSLSRVLLVRSLDGGDLSTAFATHASAIAQDSRVTNSTIIDYYTRNRIVVDRLFKEGEAIRRARPTWRGFSGRVASVLLAEFEAIDPRDAQYFFDRIKDGAGLDVNHPIMALIRYGDRGAVARDSKPSATIWAAMLVKSWNAFREGRTVHNLSFRAGGASPEAFPVAI